MSRCLPVLAIAAGLGAAVATPAPAQADVLEIGVQGHVWVAGGPALAQTGATARLDPANEAQAPAQVTTAEHPASFTQVDPGAGPQQWRLRVAELALKYDLSPALLEALVWQESRWNQSAISPAGARGLAQLMPGTARDLGVNPHDPSANLEGGARYLRMQLDAFGGDIELALAAYNAGPRRVQQAGGIPPIRETRQYVAAIMGRLSQPVRR